MKKILFITGTRADYGKIKSLIKGVEAASDLEAYVFVSGMHLVELYGSTYREVLKDGYKNIYVAYGLINSGNMSYDLGDVICQLTGYIQNIKPDMIVIHGDRIDALAGAIVGALNNIRVAHIEGGELSGTIDESIRHAISKFAHVHFVCNEEAKRRLMQLGESENRIYIIGSPDIDIMLSDDLPTFSEAKERYEIPFDQYGILMYHPVTTEYENLGKNIEELVTAIIRSDKNYIVIYPNNDLGSELIINAYRQLEDRKKYRIFSSTRFEYFLTLLKNADFMIGNSSAGVRETAVYGVPAIDIGSRQNGRYSKERSRNIQHVAENRDDILRAIQHVDDYRMTESLFGRGDSTGQFLNIINDSKIWAQSIQKIFIDR
mgnify:CR=1 FL=1